MDLGNRSFLCTGISYCLLCFLSKSRHAEEREKAYETKAEEEGVFRRDEIILSLGLALWKYIRDLGLHGWIWKLWSSVSVGVQVKATKSCLLTNPEKIISLRGCNYLWFFWKLFSYLESYTRYRGCWHCIYSPTEQGGCKMWLFPTVLLCCHILICYIWMVHRRLQSFGVLA